MEDLKTLIVERMKQVRANRQLSLDQAAELTGISKAMLSQIERGQSMPTITTLWKIATGYKVPLTYFMEQENSSFTKIDTLNTEPIYEEDGKMRTFTLFHHNPAQNFEMLYIEFEPGCVHESPRHLTGVEEYIFVKSGQIELNMNQSTAVLNETQCFRFKADIPHSYINSSQEPCSILNIIFYPTISPRE